MIWLNEPSKWSEATHYGFIRDTGHVRHATVESDFVADVVVEGAYRDRYDEAGLMLRLDAETCI